MTEDELIQAAQSGSHQAFTDLVARHQGAVRAYLCRYINHANERDDIAQDAFVAAYKALPDFAGRSSLRSWLIGIARHRALNWLRDERRRARRERRLVDAAMHHCAETSLVNASLEDDDSDAQRLRLLDHCLQKLSSEQQQLLQKRYRDDCSVEELADGLGRQAGALRVSLYRLRARLRSCIETQLSKSGAELS